MDSWEIAGHTLEYLDNEHIYLVDGVIVPSITQCLKSKFGNKYAAVDRVTLQRAADRGTEIHKAIELYCRENAASDLEEVRNFKFLQTMYGFEVLDNEVPVILLMDDEPILAGRLDLVLEMTIKADRGNSSKQAIGLADIKTTSALDKEYLAYQLNLYHIAYQQSYGREVEFLRGVHLRGEKRKFAEIPIREKAIWEYLKEYMKGEYK